jgi:hypothetical protein
MGHWGGSAFLGSPQVEHLPSWGMGHWALVINPMPANLKNIIPAFSVGS